MIRDPQKVAATFADAYDALGEVQPNDYGDILYKAERNEMIEWLWARGRDANVLHGCTSMELVVLVVEMVREDSGHHRGARFEK